MTFVSVNGSTREEEGNSCTSSGQAKSLGGGVPPSTRRCLTTDRADRSSGPSSSTPLAPLLSQEGDTTQPGGRHGGFGGKGSPADLGGLAERNPV